MKLSFIVSVLNEQQSISPLYGEIRANIGENSYEIIFIDDGSSDDSYKKMVNICQKDKNVKVKKFRTNNGKASALDAGFKRCSGDYVFTLDGDGQDNPKEISRFIKKLDEGYDLVSGWKKKRLDPISKTLPSRIFNWVVSHFFDMRLHDYNCGFKAYRKEVVKSIDVYGELHRYIPVLAKYKGFKVAEITVEHRKREFGKSKYGFERYLRGFFDFLTIRLITKYRKSPIYFFGSIGILTFLAGMAINIYLVYIKYFLVSSISNRPILFLGVLLSVIGIQFISIGLIGELFIYAMTKSSRDTEENIQETKNF